MSAKMNADRNHDRAPGMRQTSIAIPIELFEKIDSISKKEYRSRNKTIEMFLREQVDEWQKYKTKSEK